MTFRLVTLFTLVVSGFLYWFPVRRWYRRWGATDVDWNRPMLGDGGVLNPSYETTLAVTIEARAADIWPWLVQMGYRRGGLYSYDWLDRLFGFLDGPSTERILPDCQHLEVGDVIPVGRGQGFPVKAIEPCHALVLATSPAMPHEISIGKRGLPCSALRSGPVVMSGGARFPGTPSSLNRLDR